jgi:hypothetical protein
MENWPNHLEYEFVSLQTIAPAGQIQQSENTNISLISELKDRAF